MEMAVVRPGSASRHADGPGDPSARTTHRSAKQASQEHCRRRGQGRPGFGPRERRGGGGRRVRGGDRRRLLMPPSPDVARARSPAVMGVRWLFGGSSRVRRTMRRGSRSRRNFTSLARTRRGRASMAEWNTSSAGIENTARPPGARHRSVSPRSLANSAGERTRGRAETTRDSRSSAIGQRLVLACTSHLAAPDCCLDRRPKSRPTACRAPVAFSQARSTSPGPQSGSHSVTGCRGSARRTRLPTSERGSSVARADGGRHETRGSRIPTRTMCGRHWTWTTTSGCSSEAESPRRFARTGVACRLTSKNMKPQAPATSAATANVRGVGLPACASNSRDRSNWVRASFPHRAPSPLCPAKSP